jgi:hypothetical protein
MKGTNNSASDRIAMMPRIRRSAFPLVLNGGIWYQNE